MSENNYAYYARSSKTAVRKRRRRRQRIRRLKRMLLCVGTIFLICSGIILFGTDKLQSMWKGEKAQAEEFLKAQKEGENEDCPQELIEMLERNSETYDFVTSYPERDKYMGKEIDLTGEIKSGEVPLFLQWDRRWGYDGYGNEMIGLAGCGPTCMSMAYVYLTGESDMNPKKMAEFAEENGYCTEAGTSWSFFTDGAEQLGMEGEEIGLEEEKMKEVLDAGNVIVCSMHPGDFTTTGHFILIRGYDSNGFLVNDPNSKERSKQHWEYDTLYSQIKCLWSIGGVS